MKKMFVLGIAVLVMLALMGCTDDDVKDIITGGDTPDGPSVVGDWEKGVTNFDVQPGENPGEIKYKFTDTEPIAESYTLYYLTPAVNSALTITTTGQKIENITSQASLTPLNGFIAGMTYSMVVVAKKPEMKGDARTGVKKVKATENPPGPQQLKLTVNGIPSNQTIVGATLFDDALMTTQPPAQPVPKASGANINSVFSFGAYTPGSLLPGAAWTQADRYYIILAQDTSGTVRFIYNNGNETQTPEKFDFTTQATPTIEWSKFTRVQ